MSNQCKPKIVFVPGLRGHVEDHWQTFLAGEFPGSVTVPPLTENGMSRSARVENLDATLQQLDTPAMLVAHSAGCLIVAHWAAMHSTDGIIGALLATPANLEAPLPAGYPTRDELDAGGWLPVPRTPLPFPSMLAASRNDPLCSRSAALDLAMAWGSKLEDLGDVGHLNPASGYGMWSQGKSLINLMAAALPKSLDFPRH